MESINDTVVKFFITYVTNCTLNNIIEFLSQSSEIQFLIANHHSLLAVYVMVIIYNSNLQLFV